MTAPRPTIGLHVRRLRSPDSGAIGQGVRFAFAGVIVAFVYLTTTTVLADVFAVPFQLALALGYVTAVGVHFTLQRLFVWVHHTQFALGIRGQASRYLLVTGVQYALTAISTSLLPSALDVQVTLVYIVTALALGMANFLIFRGKVFHATD